MIIDGGDDCAYDYDAQVWFNGARASELLAEQQAAHAEAMKDPAYRAFIGRA